MIGTLLTKGQGLGNQLFCYVTTRCIALDNGYDFSILGKETMARNIHSDCGLYFMELDYGLESDVKDYALEYQEKDIRLFTPNSKHDAFLYGACVSPTDEYMRHIPDNTLISGIMQSEDYFFHHRDEICKWLKVKEEYDCYEYSRDNLCIIHLRCGDYMDSPELFLSKKYWINGMKHMKTINPQMEFLIITNDVKEANKLLPGIPAINNDLATDYSIIKNAKYLLSSNSSFVYFPVLTSTTLKYVLAPKYWARHNYSDGYWSAEQNIYESFNYMDRHGKVYTADECKKELTRYKAVSGKYKTLGQKPNGIKVPVWKIIVRLRYMNYRMDRIIRGVFRRMGLYR